MISNIYTSWLRNLVLSSAQLHLMVCQHELKMSKQHVCIHIFACMYTCMCFCMYLCLFVNLIDKESSQYGLIFTGVSTSIYLVVDADVAVSSQIAYN